MKKSFVENKRSADPLVDEVWDIISKVRNHIKQTNCKHCRSILEEEIAESGPQVQNSAKGSRQNGYYYKYKEQNK